MYIFVIPAAFILWYLAYDSKPITDDDATVLWKKKNLLKRNRLQFIIKQSN